MKDDSTHLTIQVRRRPGEDNTSLMVYCRALGRTIAIESCLTCVHCEGMHVDPSDSHTFLVCRAPHGALPAAVDPEPASAFEDASISELMTERVVSVGPDTTLRDLAVLFLTHNISGAPVVDLEGKPLGVVSKTDLLRVGVEEDAEEAGVALNVGGFDVALGPSLGNRASDRRTVSEVMMPLSFCLHASDRVSRAAALMAHEGVHRIVVVSEVGRVVGILSALDVLRWMARRHGYLVPLAGERG